MRRPTSLALRLTLLFALLATVVFLVFGWFIGRSIDKHFIKEDVDELKVIAHAVEQSFQSFHWLGTYNQQLNVVTTDLPVVTDMNVIKQRIKDILVGHHNALLHISHADGKQLYSSSGAEFLSDVVSFGANSIHAGVIEQLFEKQKYRVLFYPVATNGSNSYLIKVAVSIDYHLRFLEEFHRTLWLMILSGIAIIALMGWIVVQHGHRPLRKIIDRIKKINTHVLNSRIDPKSVPSELSELTVSFNEFMQRMEEDFLRLSNFSADIAHELRTPVTNLMTQTQVALSKQRNVQEYQEILYSNMEEYERMAQMIGDMLFLAKADNRLNTFNAVNIDLAVEVCNLFDYYEAWAEECNINLKLQGHVILCADALMLRHAMSNLLSNAIRHTPENGTVTVNLTAISDKVIITVENPGEVIPAEHLPKIFDRFYRVDPSRQRSGEGAGLGLAITKSIVEIHDGTIEVISKNVSTQFRIILPIIINA